MVITYKILFLFKFNLLTLGFNLTNNNYYEIYPIYSYSFYAFLL